jgi:hypothetical protein
MKSRDIFLTVWVAIFSVSSAAIAETPIETTKVMGSAAFTVDGAGMVTGVAMSAAVSDVDTLAVAIHTQFGNATFAMGSNTPIVAPDWMRDSDPKVSGTGTAIVGGTTPIFSPGTQP